MLNIVTGEKEYPAAVLIRGISIGEQQHDGPGKLTRALGIDKRFNALPATRKNGLWIEDRGVRISPRNIQKTPRIGIGYAEEWKEKPLRFIVRH